jgi:transposase
VDQLRKKIKEQEKKIAKLSKNSSNSSKCPSSDDITKPKPKPKKDDEGEKKKIGAQPGHPKHERPPFLPEEIDHFFEYEPVACPNCDEKAPLLKLPNFYMFDFVWFLFYCLTC